MGILDYLMQSSAPAADAPAALAPEEIARREAAVRRAMGMPEDGDLKQPTQAAPTPAAKPPQPAISAMAPPPQPAVEPSRAAPPMASALPPAQPPQIQPQAPVPQPQQAMPPQAAPTRPARNLAPSAQPEAPFDVPFTTKLRDALLGFGGVTPPDRGELARQQNFTYQALINKGVDPQTAKGMVSNPTLMSQLAPQVFGAKELKPITIDFEGEKTTAFPVAGMPGMAMLVDGRVIDTNRGRVLPAGSLQMPGATGAQPQQAMTPGAGPQLGTNAIPGPGVLTPSPRDPNSIYAMPPVPVGANPKTFRDQATKDIASDVENDREKARASEQYIKQAAHVRELLSRGIPGSEEGRKYGDVIGPWASASGAGPDVGGAAAAAGGENFLQSIGHLADPQAWINGARKVVGSIPVVGSEVAAGNSARQEVNKALTGLQQIELMSIYGKRPPVAGISQQREANASLNSQDAATVERMIAEREKAAFENVQKGLRAKTLNPEQIDPAVAKRGVELDVLDQEYFPALKSERMMADLPPAVRSQIEAILPNAGIDLRTAAGASQLEIIVKNYKRAAGIK